MSIDHSNRDEKTSVVVDGPEVGGDEARCAADAVGRSVGLDAMLRLCKSTGASDIHIVPRRPPYLRVDGQLVPHADAPSLTQADVQQIATTLAAWADRPPLEGPGSLDGAVSDADGTRYRFNVYRRQAELAVAIRRLEDRFRSLKELGLPESLYNVCDLTDGLVLVVGPTGSGKSTTLAALLHRINQTRRGHMITIEDPIEYVHTSAQALVNQRQVGGDTESFSEAVVASLRQDPDVILIGEIRDLSTIRTAITAAETGHLVFTTLHAGDCVGAIERFVSVFPADEQAGMRRQLAMVLRSVIAQHLLVADGPGPRVHRGADQPRRSRVVASEVLVSTPAVANLIATEKTNQIYSAMESGGAFGMQTLEQDLARLLVEGWITESRATGMARSPKLLLDRVAHIRNNGRATQAAHSTHRTQS